jgi:hypothetical protein
MTYNTLSKKTSLKKYILAWLEPSERVVLWTLDSGAIYKRSVNFFVIDLKVENSSLTEASSASLNQGEWYFDKENKELYVRMSDDSNPQNSFITLTYRIFFSNKHIQLSYNLVAGDFEVNYDESIRKITDFPQGIDPQTQSGISLESNGTIEFNVNSFWIEHFDKLFWENKNIEIYSYLPEENVYKEIFKGDITDKQFNSTKIRLKVKDFVSKLSSNIVADLYSLSDGVISESVIGKPKRTIYGKVSGLQVQSLDQTLDGYDLTGTISGTAASATITGSGSDFLDECSPEDKLKFTVNGVDYAYTISSVDSDTQITLSDTVDISFSSLSATLNPSVPYRRKNRTFLISGHKLRQPSTTISSITDTNKIVVADVSDFFPGDKIIINSSIVREIKRISSNTITTTQIFSASVGNTVLKQPVSMGYFNKEQLVIDRDWSLTNTSTGCKFVLNSLAEFNQTTAKSLSGSVSLTNGSRNVTGTGTSFTSKLKSRDWIQSTDANHTTWYEILQVTNDTTLVLRTPYAGTNFSGNTRRKNVTYIDDDSVVTVDTIGKENSSGEWVKTAADTVKDLLSNVGLTNIDIDSFTQSNEDAPYILSLALPLVKDDELPTTKNVIDLINKSVFGSLVNRINYTIAYDILSADRPQETENVIIDEDKLSYSVSTKTNVISKATCRYKHQDADRYTNEPAHGVESYESDFTVNVLGVDKGKEFDIYLYSDSDAQTMAQRIVYIRSLTQSIISIRGGSLFFADKQINDKVYFSFKNLFYRYGAQSDSSKVGVISSIKKNGNTVSIDVSDLGNLFNRTASICPNTANDFNAASDKELILNGYICDNNTELCGLTESEIQTNLIG